MSDQRFAGFQTRGSKSETGLARSKREHRRNAASGHDRVAGETDKDSN
jgi:hypothetical protein